jgi:putative transposase
VRDIVLSLPNDLRTLAQQGTRRFGELYELVHRHEASRPNALWQADHAQLDILLLREDGSAGRPWLTAVIDDYSRSIGATFSASTRLHPLLQRQAHWINDFEPLR